MTTSDDAPKSAYELAMERLRQKDAEAGVSEAPLTDEKKQEIGEIRRTYEARLAEREILYQSARRQAQDPEALEKLEEEYRRDRDRLNGDRDRKIDEARRRT